MNTREVEVNTCGRGANTRGAEENTRGRGANTREAEVNTREKEPNNMRTSLKILGFIKILAKL